MQPDLFQCCLKPSKKRKTAGLGQVDSKLGWPRTARGQTPCCRQPRPPGAGQGEPCRTARRSHTYRAPAALTRRLAHLPSPSRAQSLTLQRRRWTPRLSGRPGSHIGRACRRYQRPSDHHTERLCPAFSMQQGSPELFENLCSLASSASQNKAGSLNISTETLSLSHRSLPREEYLCSAVATGSLSSGPPEQVGAQRAPLFRGESQHRPRAQVPSARLTAHQLSFNSDLHWAFATAERSLKTFKTTST